VAGLLRAVLEKGKDVRYEARGGSMFPLIRDGDVVTISPLAGGEPRTGEVVAFADFETGRVRVHRIVRAGNGTYRLKGDHDPGEDGAFPREAILGRVVRVERRGRAVRLGPGLRSPALAWLSRSPALNYLFGRARRLIARRRGRA
jgi:hypothetical protein